MKVSLPRVLLPNSDYLSKVGYLVLSQQLMQTTSVKLNDQYENT